MLPGVKRLAWAAVLLWRTAAAVEVSCSSMRVTLDESAQCAISGLTTAGGVSLVSPDRCAPLFRIVSTRTDDVTRSATNEASSASSCAVEKTGDGVTIRYSGFTAGLESVVCTVWPDGDRIRWNIGATPQTGWAVERTTYPCIRASSVGSRAQDDAFVYGHAKGGVYRCPTGLSWLDFEDIPSPGLLAVQMCCFYDSEALLYYAAEDGQGDAKTLTARGGDGSLYLAFTRVGFDAQPFKLGYDLVTAGLDRRAGADPLTWHDAADLYRAWAEKQSWCKKKYLERSDLPDWLKEAPVMVRVRREWLRTPDDVRAWVNGYFRRQFPDVPLIMDYFGWEHYGMWCSSYFPPYPSEASFRRLVADLRAAGAHAFLWPSGYNFTLSYFKHDDGSWSYDGQADYAALGGDALAVQNRDGSFYRRTPGGSWLQGGTMACLCGGLEAVQNWWNESVTRPIGELGAEIVQVDQVVGGGFLPCWNAGHGHPLGDGRWKTACFRHQLETMRTTLRQVEADGVVTFEEANEIFNDQIGIQLARGDESNGHEWANVFTYVYHDWMLNFYEDAVHDRLVEPGYAAAEGLMPHYAMAAGDLGENRVAYDRFLSNWTRFYCGPGREFLAYGRELKPPRVTSVNTRECLRPVSSSGRVVTNRLTRAAVFCSRWRAADGRQAIVLVNSCEEPQPITLLLNGEERTFELAAFELRLIPERRPDAQGWTFDGEWYVVGRKGGSLPGSTGVADAERPDWDEIAADRWRDPGKKKLRIDGGVLLDQIPAGLFCDFEIMPGSALTLNVQDQGVFADGSKLVVPADCSAQVLPGTWERDGDVFRLVSGILKPDGKAATVVCAGDVEIAGTLVEAHGDEASGDNPLHNFRGRVSGDGAIVQSGFGHQVYLGNDLGFCGDYRIESAYGGFLIIGSKKVTGKFRSLTMKGNCWSYQDTVRTKGNVNNVANYCAEGVIIGRDDDAEEADDLCIGTLSCDGAGFSPVTGLRYGDEMIVYGGRTVRADTFSGAMHCVAHRLDQQNTRNWIRTLGCNYHGTGTLVLGEMAEDATLYAGTNVFVSVGAMRPRTTIDYTCQTDGVNTMTLDVTGTCDAAARVVAPHLAMLPRRIQGFSGQVVLTDTDERTYSLTIDLSKGAESGDYNDIGCVGSGELASAPEKGTVNVTLAGELTDGDYAIARFSSGGERLAEWTVNLVNADAYLSPQATVGVVKDETGLWIRVRSGIVFGKPTGEGGGMSADASGNLLACADWPDWDALDVPAGTRARFAGTVILDEIPSGLFSRVSLLDADTVILRASQAFADETPLVIPFGTTVTFEPRFSRDEVVDGMYRVPSTYSFLATYVGDIELNGTYRLGWHNDNEVRSVFSGNVTGAGSVFIPNWSEQMQFSGDAFGLSGNVTFDPGYGSFVIVQSKTVTCAMNAYVTPENGGWNVNCRNNVVYSGRGVVFGPSSPGETVVCTKELAFRAMKGVAGSNADGTRYGDTLIPFGGRRIRIGELTGGFHAVASRLDQFCSGQRAGKPGLLRSLTYWGRGEVAVDAMKANSYVYLSTNVDMTAGTVGSNVRFDYTLQSNAVNGATLTIAGDCATSALLVARDVSMLPARVSGFAGEVVLTDTDEKTYAVTLDLSKGTSGGAYNVGGCVGSGRLTSAPEKGTLNVKLTGERTVSGDYAIVRFTSGGALLDGWTVNVADERRGKRDCTLVRDSTGIWLRANAKGFAISVN